MTVKDNQARLHADLALLFRTAPGPHPDLRCVQHVSKAHGRLAIRTLWASADVKAYLDWPALKQALCLERRLVRLATGEISTERVDGLTSLAPDQLDLSQILQPWRGPWSIENRLHWVKDGVLKEDVRCARTATGQPSAPGWAMNGHAKNTRLSFCTSKWRTRRRLLRQSSNRR